jgi:hypothetical protein
MVNSCVGKSIFSIVYKLFLLHDVVSISSFSWSLLFSLFPVLSGSSILKFSLFLSDSLNSMDVSSCMCHVFVSSANQALDIVSLSLSDIIGVLSIFC